MRARVRNKAMLLVAGWPGVHTLPGYPEPGRQLADPIPGPHREHRPVPLLHQRHLHQRQSRPPIQ
jgi:hypothetical protein